MLPRLLEKAHLRRRPSQPVGPKIVHSVAQLWACRGVQVMNCWLRLAFGLVLLPCLSLCFTQPSLAQFPTRTIELTVPFGVGNAADVTARHLAKGMSERLGVPVTVVNRPGAGGGIAFSHVTQQPPDGYS